MALAYPAPQPIQVVIAPKQQAGGKGQKVDVASLVKRIGQAQGAQQRPNVLNTSADPDPDLPYLQQAASYLNTPDADMAVAGLSDTSQLSDAIAQSQAANTLSQLYSV
jgi:hypothetical protein